MIHKESRRILCVPDKSLAETHSIFSDLLYYDVVLSRGLVFFDGRKEHVPIEYPEYLIKLVDAGLLINPFDFSKEVSEDYTKMLSTEQTAEEMRYVIQSMFINKPLPTKPISKADADFRGLINQRLANVQVRKIAAIFHNHGVNVIPKYNLKEFFSTLNESQNELTSIIFSKLPVVEYEPPSIDSFIDFVKDEETQLKRRRLFSWQNNIETKILKGDIKVEHVPDLIATLLDDYTSWLKKSGLKLKYERREIIYYLLTSLLTVVNLPGAIKALFQLKKRKLDLTNDEKAPGRELAYIIHTQKLKI